MNRRPIIAGNWKMNGLKEALSFFSALDLPKAGEGRCDVVVCPPATLLAAASEAAAASGAMTGGQDCHVNESGAHTGDISATMLADAGARYVIVGHSERRTDHHEDDAHVQAKAVAAHGVGLVPIICVGESLEDRQRGHAEAVVEEQFKNSVPASFGANDYVVAYEPVWAIGTGETASLDDIASMHAFIRSLSVNGEDLRVLYGGSVKPGNAADILALTDVDGALVGGASLDAADFAAIIKSV